MEGKQVPFGDVAFAVTRGKCSINVKKLAGGLRVGNLSFWQS